MKEEDVTGATTSTSSGSGIPFDELAHDGIGIETNRFCVGSHKGFPEDARRPTRHIVALESLEKADAYLGALGDRSQRNLPAFALIAQPRAKAVRHEHLSRSSVRLLAGPT